MRTKIYTAASGHYIDYLPLWEYCAKRSYPEYEVKSTIIVHPKTQYYAACYRLLVDSDTDYTYVTDVDMMILRENPTIAEFHINQMNQDGLCYSNSPRTKEEDGSNRLTGLHFARLEWYEETKELREKYLHMLDSGEIGNHRLDDERMLMKICKRSGLEIPRPRPLVIRLATTSIKSSPGALWYLS